MYLITRYTVDIEIANCVEFYTNFDQNVISQLRQLYDGICYGGRLILRVIDVERVGECVINQPTSPTLGILSVAFIALVVDYKPGDLLACVGVRASRDGLTMVRAKHADIILDRTGTSREIDLLQPESVVIIRMQNTDANPGYKSIAARGSIFAPDRATYYYPIEPGTIADADESPEMTRAIYAPLSAMLRAFDGALASAQEGDFANIAHGVNVREALRDAVEAWESAEANEKLKTVIAPSMFNTLPVGVAPQAASAGFVRADLVDCRIPRGTTCLVMRGDVPPLSGKIDIATIALDQIPADWKRGAIAQPAGTVLAARMEHQINVITAGMVLLRELTNPARLSATAVLMRLWDVQRKGKPSAQ